MERYNARFVDEVGRITIPLELLNGSGLKRGSTVAMQLIGSIVTVLKTSDNEAETESFSIKIDDIGRLKLPPEIMRKMGWGQDAELSLIMLMIT